jgi:hypothetical protein
VTGVAAQDPAGRQPRIEEQHLAQLGLVAGDRIALDVGHHRRDGIEQLVGGLAQRRVVGARAGCGCQQGKEGGDPELLRAALDLDGVEPTSAPSRLGPADDPTRQR